MRTTVSLAAGGFIAALLASTCCVFPTFITVLGVGTALLSTLSAVATYEVVYRLAAIVLLAAGFWLFYAPPKALQSMASCSPSAARYTQAFLWAGAAMMALVLTAGWWMNHAMA